MSCIRHFLGMEFQFVTQLKCTYVLMIVQTFLFDITPLVTILLLLFFFFFTKGLLSVKKKTF